MSGLLCGYLSVGLCLLFLLRGACRRLLGLFSRLRRLLLVVLRSLREIDLVVLQHLGVCHGVFCKVTDYGADRLVAVGGYSEESEGSGVLALADEVGEESLQRVLSFGEFNEVREFRRLYIGHLWCAVLVESGHRAYLPGVVVAGDKHFF